MKRCKRFFSPLVHLRTRAFSGPFFQRSGSFCVKGPGNAYAFGGQLAPAMAAFGQATAVDAVQITFTKCVDIPGPGLTGIEIQVNGGAWTEVTAAAEDDPPGDGTVWTVTPDQTLQAGDEVRWRYDSDGGANGSILDCSESADIGDQDIPVTNAL